MATFRSIFARRTSILVVFLLATVLAVGFGLWGLPGEKTRWVPDIELTLFDGTRASLAEMRGRPLLVTFWATTCPPCVEELPDLIALYQELRARGLQMVAIAMPYDPPNHVLQFRDQHRIPYPIALDVEGHAVRAFGVSVIPVAYLITPDGRIEYTQAGKLDTGRVRQIVAPHLEIAPAS
jgi:peroxiredoxin